MKKLFLICNAHLDPMWLWTWQEGAAEALSTFRVAADFCEEYDSFVFNHNESVLYEWVEEYEPELFERIKKLVKMGKWHIMGGWYLQPDCIMPSGESFIRQIGYGRKYFKENFGIRPTTAINFDPFGHTRGLVQILKKTGYDSYVFMRDIPSFLPRTGMGDFIWRGFDGSEVIGHKTLREYNTTLKGDSLKGIETVLAENPNSENMLVTWGVGNHGGGPSKIDIEAIAKYKQEHKELDIEHSYCEKYFKTVDKSKLRLVDKSLTHCMAGCYTSMVRIKQANRTVENKLELMKRMISQTDIEVDETLIERAEKALMLSQFHDVLPGSLIKKAEEDSLRRLGFAEEICDKYIAKAFFKLCSGQKKCKNGEIPVLVYNPMPYSVTREIEVEFQMENQNWNEDEFTVAKVRNENGQYLPTQNEKEDCTFNLDWRKKISFTAELKPMAISRFDCELEVVKGYKIFKNVKQYDSLLFKNEHMSVKINKDTGLLDEYIVYGKSLLKTESAKINVYDDNEDPWGMNVESFNALCGEFKLLTTEEANAFRGYPEETVSPITIIEDGEVRTKVQALFGYSRSYAAVTYTIPKNNVYVDIDIEMYSNDANKFYKMSFDTTINKPKFMCQTAFGTQEYEADGREINFHKWCGFENQDKKLYVINNGTYAGHAKDSTLNISILRTPVCSAFPIYDRQVSPHDRVSDHIDMGVRNFRYRLTACDNIDCEAESFNMPPYALSFFPTGSGNEKNNAVDIDNKDIILSTLQIKEGKTLIRLYNSQEKKNAAECSIFGKEYTISFGPFEVKTFILDNGVMNETNMLGE